MSRTSIVMEDGLQEEAKALGLNVSEVCREAVAAAIKARMAVQAAGDDFETVQAYRLLDEWSSVTELVEFVGRRVRTIGDMREELYVTARGRPAVVDQGILWTADTVDELPVSAPVRQELQAALGLTVRPTIIDI